MNVATTMDPESRAKRFKAASTAAHERVDHAIMAAQPFANTENYKGFLRFQYRLHSGVEALYADEALQPLLPELADRSRLGKLEQDFADLNVPLPTDVEAGAAQPLPEALGWLYVIEGSNMGAAFLAKEAAKIGLSDDFGARHLAGHSEGRGLHWRRFIAALDAVELTPSEDERAQQAAAAAFAHVYALVQQELG